MASQAQWAVKMWQVLIAKATQRQTITYESLCALVGWHGVLSHIGPFLDLIQEHCQDNDAPQLPVLVVRKDTGRPSPHTSYYHNVNLDKMREKVFAYPWYELLPPCK